MIKSSGVSLKFANSGKLQTLELFIKEYRKITQSIIDELWTLNNIPTYISSDLSHKIKNSTWISARMIQSAGKQASGIVRGTRRKQEKRLFIIKRLREEGKVKEANKLQKIYDSINASKPNLKNVNPELDSRFFTIDLNTSTSFDGWIKLGSVGRKILLSIPFKRHKHFNKLYDSGLLNNSIRISKHSVTFSFKLYQSINNESNIIGVDVGQNSTISLSTGVQINKDNHGHDYKSICGKLARKRRGSKSFKRSVAHRTNYLHWAINQINFNNVGVLIRENIKHLKRGRKISSSLKHWSYVELFDILDSKCSEQGVLVQAINPKFTSQRCSACGWVQRANRHSADFVCMKCGNTLNADINASMNIAQFPELTQLKNLHQSSNKIGFYWMIDGQEPIVPASSKPNLME